MTGARSCDEKQRTWRVPASMLEEVVATAVDTRFQDLSASTKDQRIVGPERLKLETKTALELVSQIRIAPGRLDIDLLPDAISKLLEIKHEADPEALKITLPFTERRRGVEMKLVAKSRSAVIDQTLLTNVALANSWYQQLKTGHTFDEIASEAGTSKRRVQQIVELAFLAPDIVRDITKGLQPTGLTSDWCLRHALPAEWQAQRELIVTL